MTDYNKQIQEKSRELAQIYVNSGKKEENIKLFPVTENNARTDDIIVVAVYRVKSDGTSKKAATIPVSSQVTYCKTCGRPY